MANHGRPMNYRVIRYDNTNTRWPPRGDTPYAIYVSLSSESAATPSDIKPQDEWFVRT